MATACRRAATSAARFGKGISKSPSFSPCYGPARSPQTSSRSINVTGFGQPPSARWVSVCMESLLPLHSTIAASRLVSRISTGDCLASAIFRGLCHIGGGAVYSSRPSGLLGVTSSGLPELLTTFSNYEGNRNLVTG